MEVTVRDVTLTCQSELSSQAITFRYAVVNRGEKDIYLLDIFPAVAQDTRTAVADFQRRVRLLEEPISGPCPEGHSPASRR